MQRNFLRPALIAGICSALLSATQVANAALILNYEYESVTGAVGSQTTSDSSLNYTSSTPPTAPNINTIIGTGTNLGVDHPNFVSGPNIVSNLGTGLMSLNPSSYINTPNLGSRATQIDDGAPNNLGATANLDRQFTNMTISFWVNPASDLTASGYIIAKMGANGNRGFQVTRPAGTDDLNFNYFATTATAGGSRDLYVLDALPVNTWTHVAVTFGVNSDAIYINNVLQSPTDAVGAPLVGSALATLNAANNQPFNVGYRANDPTRAFLGGIDDVRIYNETFAFSPTGSLTGTGSLLQVIPEPSTFAIAAMGLVGLVMLRRRK